MRHERNIEGLKDNAAKKRQEAFERTDKAIQQLIKQKKKINFNTVAEAANVSKAWLYKEPEIKSRIESLRGEHSGTNNVPVQERTSDSSWKAKYQTLKDRLQKVEAENRGLREQLEVAYGRILSVSELEYQVEYLEKENLQLKEHLKLSHEGLTRTKNGEGLYDSSSCPPDKSRGLEPSPFLEGTMRQSQLPKQASHEKPSVLNFPSKKASGTISETIKKELDALGIKLNSTLASKIKNSTEEAVLTAIEALKEQLQTTIVRSPGGWLSTALSNNDTWEPNQPLGQETDPADLFSEWYDLAREFGLVIASRKEDDGFIWVQETTGQWVSFTEMSSKWTTKYLKSRVVK